jgi:hypothetical protein
MPIHPCLLSIDKSSVRKIFRRTALFFTLAAITLQLLPLTSSAAAADPNSEYTFSDLNLVSAGTFKRCESVNRLLCDSQNRIWICSDGAGLFCIAADRSSVQCFKTGDGLGDNYIYGIAEDRQGRIWVGHRSHGISVYNNKSWKNYGILDGPVSERIFDIAVNPVDDSVWIAGSAGLCSYRTMGAAAGTNAVEKGRWSYCTRADGLPEDQITSMAFTPAGTLYAGTFSHGLAIGRRDSRGKMRWKNLQAQGSRYDRMLNPIGDGLPSDQINDVLAAADGRIYVATAEGLGIREPDRSWHYVRGRSIYNQVKELYTGADTNLKARVQAFVRNQTAWKKIIPRLPQGEYISCLAEAGDGKVWLACRSDGTALFQPGKGELWHTPKTLVRYLSRAIAANKDGSILLGGTSKRMFKITPAQPALAASKILYNSSAADTETPFPAPAAPPSEATILKLLQAVAKQTKNTPAANAKYPYAAYLGEDWSTGGDWVGSYGADASMLCAIGGFASAKSNIRPTIGDPDNPYFWVEGLLGPHFRSGDSIRLYVHCLKTKQRRVLYHYLEGLRCEAECDDHGETYHSTFEGPDMWFYLRLKKGLHKISFYFINPNGHLYFTSMRDYTLEVRRFNYDERKPVDGFYDVTKPNWKEVLAEPVICRSRVRNFYGGVYKQFLMRGTGRYMVKISRNHSRNTILSGVFIDTLPEDGKAKPWRTAAWIGTHRYAPPEIKLPQNASPKLEAAYSIWQLLETHAASPIYLKYRQRILTLLYRALRSDPAAETLCANIHWQLPIYTKDNAESFTKNMAAGYIDMERVSALSDP